MKTKDNLTDVVESRPSASAERPQQPSNDRGSRNDQQVSTSDGTRVTLGNDSDSNRQMRQ